VVFAANAAGYTVIDLYMLNVPAGFDPTFLNVSARGLGPNLAGSAPAGTPFLWPGTGTAIDLTPTLPGISGALANGTNGAQTVGSANGPNTPAALYWSGPSAASAVNLTPASGFPHGALAYGVSPSGNEQVGEGQVSLSPLIYHALLWHGSAASVADLTPTNLSGYTNSIAYATNGSKEVGAGSGFTPTANNDHAMLWSGTPDSAVDLHPTVGYVSSDAYGISPNGNQQVGVAFGGSPGMQRTDAFLWTGSALTAVNLRPVLISLLTSSGALATNGSQQVGYIGSHAAVWSGTGESAVDLGAMLSSDFSHYDTSTAYAIDPDGNVYGFATDNLSRTHLIEWAAVPEPASLALPLAALILTVRRQCRRQCRR
jgi:hypothetical protein